jgi:branched-chain amino acid transport system ATP-binding protein
MSVTERFRRWLENITGDGPTFPLLILFAIYFFDEFDTAAFGVLAPEIKRAFDLSNQEFLAIIGANLNIVLLLAVPLGYFGDRLPRRSLVVGGAIVAGVFSFATGLAGSVLLLVLIRIGNGIGVLVNDPIHRSLLSDYYKPEARPTVFATHANAVRYGAIVGSALAGVLAFAFGWRVAFMVLIVPIIAVAVLALRLPPVHRGQSDDEETAAAAAEEKPFPFGRSARILWNVSTLRRQYVAWLFIGAAFLPLAGYIPIYYDDEFHMNPLEIGLLVAVGNAVALVGVQLSGRWTRNLFAKGLGEPLKLAGLSLVAVGPTMFILAVAPNLAVAVFGMLLAYFVGGFFGPPFYTVQSIVSPARTRSLSFGFAFLFLVIGLDAFTVFFGGMANDSVRVGLATLAPMWVIGGLILYSAKSFVANDATRALSVMTTTATLRQERLAAGDRSLLVCRNVDVSYGQTQVLFGVNFDVKEGEVVALLGTNGAGKSTLLKAVSGSIEINGGAIFYDGEDMTGLGAAQVTAAGVALVPGGKGVFPGLTVEENFALAGWLLRRDDAYIADALDESLSYFPVLRERWDQKAGNLSGGEQQMLTIAMAMLAQPKLLMIDELSLGLAPIVVEMLLEVVRRISERGVTVILVEQSVNVALTLAQRAVFMEKGEIRFDGPTAELLERPDVLRSVFLEGAAAAVEAPTEGLADGTERIAVVDRLPYVLPTDRKGRVAAPLLSIHDLSVSFGGIKAVNGVDLDVWDGQIVGLIGPNGAGKTTIFDLVCGLLPADSGKIVLAGSDISDLSADARGRRGLGRSFQDARLFPSMTARETIAVALERHLPVKDPLAAVFASPATKATEKWVDQQVDRLIELMRLNAFANKFIFELSTGSRRIVDLACTLAHEPTVLLLDEPSSGIAQRETEALGPLLLDIRDETGAALVVIEHDMPLITSISDEIVALELGAVVVRGTPDEVVNDPRVVAAYLGTTEEAIHRSGELHDALTQSPAAKAKTTKKKGTGDNSSSNGRRRTGQLTRSG